MAITNFIADATANDFILFCDDVKRIPSWQALFSDGCAVSAIRILPRSNDDSERNDVVARARSFLSTEIHPTNSRLWLFLMHSPWQPNNRIVNYRKIWGDLSLQSLQIPQDVRGPEIRYESKEGVRYATIMSVEEDEFAIAADVLTKTGLGMFFYRTTDQERGEALVDKLCRTAFDQHSDETFSEYVNWGRLIHWAAMRHDIVAKRSDEIGEMRFAIDIFVNAKDITNWGGNGAAG